VEVYTLGSVEPTHLYAVFYTLFSLLPRVPSVPPASTPATAKSAPAADPGVLRVEKVLL